MNMLTEASHSMQLFGNLTDLSSITDRDAFASWVRSPLDIHDNHHVFYISPELATWILEEFNTANIRTVSKNRVDAYLRDMRTGNWEYNGETLLFRDDGILSNGQHRLKAVSLQDRTYPFLCVRGLTKRANRGIDQGRSRTVACNLSQTEWCTKNAKEVASICNLLSHVWFKDYCRHSPASIEEMVVKYGLFPEISAVCSKIGKIKTYGTAPVLTALVIAHRSHPAHVKAFAEQVKTGELITKAMPAYRLRQYLEALRGATNSVIQIETVMKSLAAVYDYIKGKNEIRKLSDGTEALAYFSSAYGVRING